MGKDRFDIKNQCETQGNGRDRSRRASTLQKAHSLHRDMTEKPTGKMPDLPYTQRSKNVRIPATAIGMAIVAVLATAGCLLAGSVEIPAADVWGALTGGDVAKETWRVIVTETRVPMVITAAVTGAALAIAGLLLQTCFNNPLAGPSILGISTGASLGVAIVVMAFGGMIAGQWSQYFNIMAGALTGAAAVLAVLMALSRLVKSTAMLLIAGILVGYFASSAISLLNYYSSEHSVYSFTIWGLGSLSGGSWSRSMIFASIGLPVILLSTLFVKPLNAMLLGERYAASLGIDIRRTRHLLLAASGILTAIVTAFCGPIGFLGLVVPHIARMLLRTSNHSVLMPVTALCGAAVTLLCAWISVAFGSGGVIPINAITPIIGVPVVLYVMLNRKRLLYFD